MYGYSTSMFLINSFIFETASATDPDADAFISATGITDATQMSAINTLVVDLKSYGLWTKLNAIYPFIGGTATTHKYNLKDARDLDVAHRIVWFGGYTHDSNGITGNGVNAYADTFLNNNALLQNSNHLSVYVRTAGTLGARTDLGSWSSTFGSNIYSHISATNMQVSNNHNGGASVTLAGSVVGAFYLNNRISSTEIMLQNRTDQATIAKTSNTYITTSFKLSKTGDYSGEYSNRNLAFATLGDGLTGAEGLDLNTVIETFETTLSRNV